LGHQLSPSDEEEIGNVEPVIQNIIPDLKEEWKIPTFPRSIYRWTGPRNPFACPNLWDLNGQKVVKVISKGQEFTKDYFCYCFIYGRLVIKMQKSSYDAQ